MTDSEMLSLGSTHSLAISLRYISEKGYGLDEKRKSILSRVPSNDEWGSFRKGAIDIIDLAYLTAFTGDEFALLRGKHGDVLFHGNERACNFPPDLAELLIEKKYSLEAHSHPNEDDPIPSREDRRTLTLIRQTSSKIVSATTGRIISFTENEFEDMTQCL